MKYYGKVTDDKDLVTKEKSIELAQSEITSALESGGAITQAIPVTDVQANGTSVVSNKIANITAESLGLSQALKFIGISTTEITDGGTEDPTIPGYTGTAKTVGNVVIYNNNEFVWANSCWNKLGDDSSWQTKITATGILKGAGSGSISAAVAGTDYQAAVTATGILKGAGSGSISAATAGTDYVHPDSISSVTFNVPAFTTSTTITDLTGITANTIGVFGLATTATSAQYTAATDAQLLLTAQGTGTVTITAMAGSLSTAVPCVINIMK